MRRPNKPHKDGYEDEEDCEGYYDPDEAERRRCHTSHLRFPQDPCEICFQAWKKKEDARLQAIEDAMTPDEKIKRAEFLAELRKAY